MFNYIESFIMGRCLEWLNDLDPDEAVTQEDIRYVETD